MDEHRGGGLHGELRKKMLPPEAVLENMGVAEGDTLLEIGAGTGYFAIPAARFVGERGRVIASDISERSLEELKSRIPPSNSNIRVLLGEEGGVDLPPASADKILMAFVLHEIEDKKAYLLEAKRLLKPGGELTVVEWDTVDSPMGPAVSERIALTEALRLAREAGFHATRYSKLNDFHYICTLKAE